MKMPGRKVLLPLRSSFGQPPEGPRGRDVLYNHITACVCVPEFENVTIGFVRLCECVGIETSESESGLRKGERRLIQGMADCENALQ